ncbi:hypothetical protein [uncultured Bacteroides sp.]|uniref:hypothetical protein n=1 Tax=uncultured Bacteroides sp. TaxID=162156 RepID=UPI002AAAFA8D|nr:hypothetical protein [uncultured Bacteroides sp.]
MQRRTCSKNTFNEEVSSEITFVFDHSHELGTSIAMFLIHTKTGVLILLQRIILQVHKNKEKAFRRIRQRAVLIYAGATKLTSAFAIHFILRQIITMSYLKVGKQMGKLNMS